MNEEDRQLLSFLWWCVTEDVLTTTIFALGLAWFVAFVIQLIGMA